MKKTLILGLGNILCGDEGIGCRLTEHLFAYNIFPENVLLNDGGTMGQELLGRIMETDNLLIIDCADFGKVPGETTLKYDNEIPVWLAARKMSPHQTSFAEVLALAQLKNSLPEKMALMGIQPNKINFGDVLSPLLQKRLLIYEEIVKKILLKWQISFKPTKNKGFLNNTPTGIQYCEKEWAKTFFNTP